MPVAGRWRYTASGRPIVTESGQWLVSDGDPDQECCCPPEPCSCPEDDPNLSANLVTNGGFETDSGTSDATAEVSPSNWTVVSGRPSVIRSTPPSGDGGFPMAPEGSQYLAGGPRTGDGGVIDLPGVPVSVAEQTIDLSSYSDAIDAGQGCFRLSARLGTYGDGPPGTPQDDEPMVQALSGATVLAQIGPIVGNVFGFNALATSQGQVPVGVNSITIRLTMTRDPTVPHNGYYNDGYIDDVRFQICAAENGA